MSSPLVRRIIVALAAAVGGLIVAETVLTAYVYWGRDPMEQFDLSKGAYELVPGEYRHARGEIRINSDGFVGPELGRAGATGLRVVALGDSCTFGEGDGQHTYPAMLGRLLDEQRPGGFEVEVVNAGLSGIGSEQALRRLRNNVLPLSPDVVVVFIGWNDLMKYGPRAQSEQAWDGRLARSVDGLWLVRGLRKLYGYYLRPALADPVTEPRESAGPLDSLVPTYFERNLAAIVKDARGSGASVVLATLPTRVHDGMTAAELREAGVAFPYFVGGDVLGDFVDLIDAYNDAIRRVAHRHGVLVVDLAADFEREQLRAGYFWDAMHLTPRGMDRVARQLLPAVTAALNPAPSALSPPAVARDSR